MAKMNVGRVILGGIVAGLVADILDYPVDGVWLAQRWSEQFKALGQQPTVIAHQWVWLELLGILCGLVAVWLYAAMRPRYGAGPKTAIYAGFAVWVLSAFIPNVGFMYLSGLFGRRLTLYTTAGALVEIVVGTILGAWLYKEPAPVGRIEPADTKRQAVGA